MEARGLYSGQALQFVQPLIVANLAEEIRRWALETNADVHQGRMNREGEGDCEGSPEEREG